MEANSSLVSDLALILITAGITTLIFKALKQPLILGYIVAGFLVGPHFGFFPDVVGSETIGQWSEIGIIFLLFGLGLEFSFKKLIKVGSTALIIVVTILVCMTMLGFWIGCALGWNNMECIFLGSMLSMSSTTIIVKAFNDMNLKQPFTQVVYGALIVEDLLAVVVMVLLSTMAASKNFAGGEMVKAITKLLFCLILWFLVGMYLVPSLLKLGRKVMNDEVLTILSIGLCFTMVVISMAMGFSSALGAFVMGSILAETIESEKIIHLIKGIKDIFGAVFFVSVGMLIDPNIIIEYWQPVLILTLTVMIFLPLFATVGVLFAGKGLHISVRAGMTMSQIGEFAFIVASVGASLKVMSGFLYPVIVAVSVITTFTTPYYIKYSEKIADFLAMKLPPNILKHLQPVPAKNDINKQSRFNQFLKISAIRTVVYSVLTIAVFIASNIYLQPFVSEHFDIISPFVEKLICTGVVLSAMAPFLLGIIFNSAKQKKLAQGLWSGSTTNQIQLAAIMILRMVIVSSFVLTVIFHYFSVAWWAVILIIPFGLVLIAFTRVNIKRMNFLENRFIENLNQKEKAQRDSAPVTTAIQDSLEGEDIHIEAVVVSQNSIFVGSKLGQMNLRSIYSVNIVKITRGKRIINIPSPQERIFPGDRLVVFGTSQKIERFISDMETELVDNSEKKSETVSVETGILSDNSLLTGKILRLAGLREAGCMLLGLSRNGLSVMNPDPDLIFEQGDKVWIVGQKDDCIKFL